MHNTSKKSYYALESALWTNYSGQTDCSLLIIGSKETFFQTIIALLFFNVKFAAQFAMVIAGIEKETKSKLYKWIHKTLHGQFFTSTLWSKERLNIVDWISNSGLHSFEH